MPAAIRTGVVGYGLSGEVFHCPFIESSPEFSLDLIATSDPERRARAQAAHPDARIADSVEEILHRAADLDLLVLASPPATHLEHGLRALDNGLALIIDKPFVPAEADGVRLIEKARERNLPLMVFQNRRWDADFLTIRRVLSEGALGTVYQFESRFEHWAPEVQPGWKDGTPPERGGGVTFDLGSHLIDQALVLFGPVTSARGDLRTVRAGGGNDDVSFVELLHHSGVRSHLWMSRIGGQPGPRFRVLGTEAAFVSQHLDSQEPELASGMLPTDPRYGVEPEAAWGTLGVAAPGYAAPRRVPMERGSYTAFYEGAAAAVRGLAPSPVDPLEALEVVKLLEKLRSSMNPG